MTEETKETRVQFEQPLRSPPLRRASVTPEKAFTHVLAEVLGFGETSVEQYALEQEGATSVADILMMTQEDLYAIEYTKGTQDVEEGVEVIPPRKLTKTACRKLLLVKPFQAKMLKILDREPDDVLSDLEWCYTKHKDFEKFRAFYTSPSEAIGTTSQSSTPLIRLSMGISVTSLSTVI